MATHIDEWIDDIAHSYEGTPQKIRSVMYAAMFFELHRFPAWKKTHYAAIMEEHGLRLFCTYGGKRWRVTGCSRLGDVWLTSNFEQVLGYETRVAVDECSDWSPTPDQ